MIAPCYQESIANEVLSTVGGVTFIKWTQDLVSFVKCEPPSILPCGDKCYDVFKDVLAPICFFLIAINLEWHLRQRVMLEDPRSQPLSSLTLKRKSFVHNKRQKSW